MNEQTAQAFNVALAYQRNGQLELAAAAYQQAIAENPNDAGAYMNLGNVLKSLGRLDEAIDIQQRAIALAPGSAVGYCNLAGVLRARGRSDEAVAAYRQALAIKPDFPEALNNLAVLLRDLARWDEAVAACRRAIELKPDFAEAHNNLGVSLQAMGRFDEAITAYRQATALRPEYADAYYNLGLALQKTYKFRSAVEAYRQAISLNRKDARPHYNLGTLFQMVNEPPAAIAAYYDAISLQPNYVEAHWNLALALLSHGDYANGFREYEWRWRRPGAANGFERFDGAPWDGKPQPGKSLFLYVEQGFGDTIQFVRFVPLIARMVGRLILECQAQLERLVRANLPGVTVISRGAQRPPCDLHFPLMSVGQVLAPTPEAVPAPAMYLRADPALAEEWGQRVNIVADVKKVGLAWAGSRRNRADRDQKSIPPALLLPLAAIPNVQFYSLQKDDAEGRFDRPPRELILVDLTSQIYDFADTAALISNLDLVITVDTSMAHLAGAMGKPVWLMLPYTADWRWMINRSDSTWYPSMRIFRQPKFLDWKSVIDEVVAAAR